MRREDKDYVSPNTRYRKSFLVALGYSVERVAKGRTSLKDLFLIKDNGTHIPLVRSRGGKKQNVPYVSRADFFAFARQHHKSLRQCEAERKIEYAVD